MLEIAVCEDERYAQGILEELLYRLGKKRRIQLEVDVYERGESLLRAIERGERYDLIYLDIEMEGMNGIETAEKIREEDRITQIIYVTSHDRYALASTRTMPSDFLVKPIEERKFEETFLRVTRWICQKDVYFRFISEKAPCKIPLREIMYFQSDLRQVWIVSETERRGTYRKLGEIEKELEKGPGKFIRIHRSFLVNYNYIKRFRYDTVELLDGSELPVSRGRREMLQREILGR